MINLLLDYKNYFEKALDEYLSKILSEKTLLDAFKYSIQNGGKRLRPFLVYLGAKATSKDMFDENIRILSKNLAIGIELIHSYSLVHDDLPCMDNDEYRRGKKTTHIVYGAGMATLTGDAMLTEAANIMLAPNLEYSNYKKYYLNQVYAAKTIIDCSGLLGMVGGQAIDLVQDKSSYTKEDILIMYKMKTSGLFRAALTSGAILMNADDDVIMAFDEYATNLGILFQIVDDILDKTSTKEVLGKSVNQDEKNNKLTYVDLVGIEQAKIDIEEIADRAKEEIYLIKDKISCADVFFDLIDELISRDR